MQGIYSPLAAHLSVVLACLFATIASAEEPPTSDKAIPVENLLTSKGKVNLGFGLVYANSERSRVQVGDMVLIQTGPSQFVRVPIEVGELRVNTDTLVATPSLRYGVTENTQLSLRGSYSTNYARTQGLSGSDSSSSSRFVGAYLGIDHRLQKEGKTPGLIGLLDVALAENNSISGSDISYARSWLIGITAYRVFEPLVLSATAAYQMNLARQRDGQQFDPGNLIVFSPSLNFIPNRDSSFGLGFAWVLGGSDVVDGSESSIVQTRTDLNLYFSYAWSKPLLLFFTLNSNISGKGGASIGLSSSYTFGGSG